MKRMKIMMKKKRKQIEKKKSKIPKDKKSKRKIEEIQVCSKKKIKVKLVQELMIIHK